MNVGMIIVPLATFLLAVTQAVAQQSTSLVRQDTTDYVRALGRSHAAGTYYLYKPTKIALTNDGRWLAHTSQAGVVIRSLRSSDSVVVRLPGVACSHWRLSWIGVGQSLVIECSASPFEGGASVMYIWRRDTQSVDSVAAAILPPIVTNDGRLVYAARARLTSQTARADRHPVWRRIAGALPDSLRCGPIGLTYPVGLCSDTVDVLQSAARVADLVPAERGRDSGVVVRSASPVQSSPTRIMLFDPVRRAQTLVAQVDAVVERIVYDEKGGQVVLLIRRNARDGDGVRLGVPVSLPPTGQAETVAPSIGSLGNLLRSEQLSTYYKIPDVGNRHSGDLVFSSQNQTFAWIVSDPTSEFGVPRAVDTLVVSHFHPHPEQMRVPLDVRRDMSDSMPAPRWLDVESKVLFTPTGSRILILNRGALWVANLNSHRLQLMSRANDQIVTAVAWHSDHDALVITNDVRTGRSAVSWVDLSTCKWSLAADLKGAVVPESSPLAVRNEKDRSVTLVYSGWDLRAPPSIYWLQLNRASTRRATPVSVTRPLVPVTIPSIEDTLFSYHVTPLVQGVGILVRPAGAKRPLPTIVQAYPYSRSYFWRAQSPGLLQWGDAFAAIARGYAVLFVDVPVAVPTGVYGSSGPVKNIVQGMTVALEAAARTGWVDTSRLGITGHSYGGYMVNLLVTHTRRFRAAVSVSGVANLVSFSSGGTGYGPDWVATIATSGKMRTRSALTDIPEQYVANSPIAFLDSVTTPLLLVHGVRDATAHISQSEELFRGLAQLGKVVELVRYHHEAHSSDHFFRAAWLRALDWFDQYLQ